MTSMHHEAPAGAAYPAGSGAPARRYARASRGRVLGGVCRGLADHLGVDVSWVRVAFLVLVLADGAGAVAYAALWVLAPLAVEPTERGDVSRGGAKRELGYLGAVAALLLGGLLVLDNLGLGVPGPLVVPLAVVSLGVVMLWRQADEAQRSRWVRATSGTGVGGIARAVLGVLLVVVGLVVFLSRGGDLNSAGQVLVASLVIVLGVGVIIGPWLLRMARELSDERAARIREQERAEVAAHVHDSVLHTLTLIQRHVEDPRAVARLARAQERELRTWLYRPVADPDTTLTAAVERCAAEVEDAHGVTVEVVVVGDYPLDDGLRALLHAAREALVNAAKYADGAPISLFAEVEPGLVTVFVRDRGPGFDLDAVPDDRLGVRQSVIGRMQRNGGAAVVRSAPGDGTEVQLEMPVPERGGAA